MDNPKCWTLTLEGLVQSWNEEVRELRAAQRHATGRAWMVLNCRAEEIALQALHLREAMTGEAPLATVRTRLLEKRNLLGQGASREQAAGQVCYFQSAGNWHAAFAIRQSIAIREEIDAALLEAMRNEVRSEVRPLVTN